MSAPGRVATALLLALAFAPVGAAAQERVDPSVEAEHRRGIEARVAGRDAEARDIFRGLYERTREPRALARQALAEGAMGAWAVAEGHLLAALEARDDPWIRASRDIRGGLAENLALFRAHLCSLDVSADAPGAELWVDGARVGALPLARPLRVAEGEVAFEVRAPGRAPALWRERVDACAEPRPVAVALAALPPATAPAAAPPVLAPPAPRPAPTPAPDPPRRPWARPAGVAALALGAAGVVAGAALLGLAHANEARFEGYGCRAHPRGARSDCDAIEDDTRDVVEPLEAAAFVAGGLFTAAGVALLLAVPPSRGAGARALPSCAPAAGGVRCGVTF